MNITEVFFNNGQWNWDAISTIFNTLLVGALVIVTLWYANQVKKQTKFMKVDRLVKEMDKLVAPLYSKVGDNIIFQKGAPGNIDAKGCHGPTEVRPLDVCGLSWNGEPEAITRLYFGFSNHLPNVLKDCGLDNPKIKEIMDKAQIDLKAQMVFDAMPIQDAIDLARFLVDVTKNFLKFIPGAPTVGGATEIAAITKHEGYKWVSRKFYYDQKYNLGGV